MAKTLGKDNRWYYGLDTNLLENKWLRYFCKWYLDGAKEEEFQKWGTLSDNIDYALENYLKRDDVIRCIADFTKRQKDMDFMKLYNTMLEKALNGDTKSADWILKAQDSDFFKTKSKSAIDNIIEGIDVNDN